MADLTEAQLQEKFNERFAQLPKIVQDAITSADVEDHLRKLADEHKLHIDQWQLLENDVMLTLLGFQEYSELAENIRAHVGLDEATAIAIAEDVSKIVFEPIRAELETNLHHPDAEKTGEMHPGAPIEAAPAVQPATPPIPAPEKTVERAPVDPAYKPGQPSTERKDVHTDPYRESIS